jgi:hypothetical protein
MTYKKQGVELIFDTARTTSTTSTTTTIVRKGLGRRELGRMDHQGGTKTNPRGNLVIIRCGRMLSKFQRWLTTGNEILQIQLVIATSIIVAVVDAAIHNGGQRLDIVAGCQGVVTLSVRQGCTKRSLLVAAKVSIRFIAARPMRQWHEGIHDVFILDEILTNLDELRDAVATHVNVDMKAHALVDLDSIAKR